jgi:uracil-DNA glycosylase family 4
MINVEGNSTMDKLLHQVRNCKVCEQHLKEGVNPVVAASPHSKLVIVGQAPGRKVHATGIPWNDKSGDNLRSWLGINTSTFYDTKSIALIPMGFCFPGTGKTGDLPPRPECAPLWHQQLLTLMPQVRLVLLVGQYAQNHYLKDQAKNTLTETVRHFNTYLPHYFPLPHPSPRNNIWQAKNEWFAQEVLPELKKQVQHILG